MRRLSLSDLSEDLAGLADQALEASVRLGVTGLRRSGKTVFVTSLIDNLLRAGTGDGGRLPFLEVVATGRYQAARLRPQPDQAVPRFDYEGHRAALTAEAPRWPEPTRGISQARVTLRYRPGGLLRRRLRGLATLNLDIVDYPGEWLLDLPLLTQDYAAWSQTTLERARRPPRDALSAPWRATLEAAEAAPMAPADETVVRRLAAAYTDYLNACRGSEEGLSLIQPGRFVEPGDLAGAPVLTFCPLPPPAGGRAGRASLWALMEERFEAYKREVVRRFFREHFARLDRQIVLVDLLGALNAGTSALDDMRQALAASLEAFRHGRRTWLSRLLGGRIDRVLFAATKADHVAAPQHARLTRLLEGIVADSRTAIRFEGATVASMAIAAVKCTETVTAEHDGRRLLCVRGVPLGRTQPTALYPGELPDSLADLAAHAAPRFRFLEFRPPAGLGRDGRGLPHIWLDQALDFLIGDKLA